MLFHRLASSRVLRVLTYDDLDQFLEAERLVATEIIPLRIRPFSAGRATLLLPRSTVVLFCSHPRILDGFYSEADPVVTLTATPSNGALINGIAVRNNSIGILHGRASYSMFEKAPGWYFSIKLDNSVNGRGWPEVIDDFALFEAAPKSMKALRSELASVVMSASGAAGDALTHINLEAMEGALLSGLDGVFTGSGVKLVDQRPSGLHMRLIRQIDARLAADPGAAIYSKDLARDMGVSVRSLHSATMSVRGMSLHRYLKIRRLWLVRRSLLAAEPGAKIKSFALAHGFWHLGDFSKDYQKLFGELPSETLARAGAGAA